MHNNYPSALEKLIVSSDMLSKYCKKIADKYEIKVGDVKKLIPNLGNRTKHVTHYKNLLNEVLQISKFKFSEKTEKIFWKIGMPSGRRSTKIVMPFGMLAHKIEKLARFWHVGMTSWRIGTSLVRWHVKMRS